MLRRKEKRFNVSKTVSLRVLAAAPGPSLGKLIDASIIDFSGNGMRVCLQYSVPCGVPVEIMDKDTVIIGTICHCARQDDAFVVGIRILEYILPPLMNRGLA
jgi:PilZ domain